MGSKKVFLIRNVKGFGGGEVYQINLALELRRNGFVPTILTSSGELINRAKRNKINIIRTPYIKRQNWSGIYNLFLPIYFCEMRRLIKWYEELFQKEKPDVVNIQSRDDMIAATMAAQKYGIKVIWTDHADFKSWVLINANVRFKNIIGKTIIKLSSKIDKIIFVSENLYLETVKMIKPLRIRQAAVIKNGVIDQYGQYQDAKVERGSFVYIGRIVDDKGIRELLEAFSMVRTELSTATLNIYGAGDITRYEKIAGEGVRFCGETSEPLKALAENEIFVLPSYKEGLSLSLLDAAMMKKTIIATNIDGNPEVVEDGKTGLLVPAKNAKALAVAMEKVLKDRDLAIKLAKNARKKYEAEFDFEKIFAEKMLMLYNNGKEKK